MISCAVVSADETTNDLSQYFMVCMAKHNNCLSLIHFYRICVTKIAKCVHLQYQQALTVELFGRVQ